MKVFDKKLFYQLNKLSEECYKTSVSLATELGISEKTVRNNHKALFDSLEDSGAYIESRPSKGYRLVVTDRKRWNEFLENIENTAKDGIPETADERIQYLLFCLLSSQEYVKLDDLSELLYISKNTLSNDFRKVELILGQFHIRLIRKPNYGIRAEGREHDIRRCLQNCVFCDEKNWLAGGKQKQRDTAYIGEVALQVKKEYKIILSELAFSNLVMNIYIAVRRIKRGNYIPLSKFEVMENIEENDMLAAEAICGKLEEKFHVHFPEAEVSYIALHLAGVRYYGSMDDFESNVVISSAIDNLTMEILDTVYDAFHFDFRENLILRMSIGQHLIPLLIRLKYEMVCENPRREMIKHRSTLAYAIATQAGIPIKKWCGKELSDDETASLAELFELALVRKNHSFERKNILIVCSTGLGSAKLLASWFQEEFAEYVEKIFVCDSFEVIDKDFSEIDYVFTTTPIRAKVAVPIVEVENFLDHGTIKQMKRILDAGSSEFLNYYYDRARFFPHLSGKTKEEVISQMCSLTNETIQLPQEFYHAVLYREELASTDYGNKVAFPHSYKVLTNETFVSVGILDESVYWVHNEVQVVLLVSVSGGENPKLQEFYRRTTELIQNREKIDRLIKNRNFDLFLHLLNEE